MGSGSQPIESNTILRLVLDHIPAGVFWKDKNFHYLGANRFFARAAGRDNPDELIGLTDQDLPWRDMSSKYTSDDREVIDSGKPKFDIEEQIVTSEGEVRWNHVNKVPLKNTTGEIIGVLGLYHDITERKQVEADLRELNRSLERIVGERTEDLSRVNRELEARNRELHDALRNLEKTQAQLVQAEKLSALGQLSAGIAHELNTPLGAIISSNKSLIALLERDFPRLFDQYASFPAEHRELFLHVLSYCMTQDPEGVIDVNRRVKREIRATLSKDGINEPEKAAELITELNIPLDFPGLRGILDSPAGTELLTGVGSVVSTARMAAVTSVAAEKAAVVVSALKSYMHREAPKEAEAVDVVAGIETILTLLHNKLKFGVTIRTDFTPLSVKGSSEDLGQVWLNLINNAVQAMDYFGTLLIETERENRRGIVRIADSGPGIPEELQDKVFEPFFTTKRHGEGIGLGLDICRKVVEKHGGTIDFESRPGHTVFTVRLPTGGDP
jgi:PAS domain S-box-containing protein